MSSAPKPGTQQQRDDSRGLGRGGAENATLIIGPVFLILAGWFAFRPDRPVELPEMVHIDRAAITSEAPRPFKSDSTMLVAGFDKKCQDCHQLFRSNPNTPTRLNQHANIVQAHGMNDRCFNCHDLENRNLLALPGGATLTFAESARLCATCHGTTYRDWQAGTHGRTTGSWDVTSGNQRRLSCTECHDPHAPAFGPMVLLPGPNTLRMGEINRGHGGQRRHNPLRPNWDAHADGEGHH